MNVFEANPPKLMTLWATSLLVLTLAGPAANATTFEFNALCDDCAALPESGQALEPGNNIDRMAFQPVTGSLVLNDFTPGVELGVANFESFSYGGSVFIDAFTVSSNDFIFNVGGMLSPTGSVLSTFALVWQFNDQEIRGLDCADSDRLCILNIGPTDAPIPGAWGLGSGEFLADVGENATLTGMTAVPVPTPGSLSIVALALIGLGLARKRLA